MPLCARCAYACARARSVSVVRSVHGVPISLSTSCLSSPSHTLSRTFKGSRIPLHSHSHTHTHAHARTHSLTHARTRARTRFFSTATHTPTHSLPPNQPTNQPEGMLRLPSIVLLLGLAALAAAQGGTIAPISLVARELEQVQSAGLAQSSSSQLSLPHALTTSTHHLHMHP